MEDKSYESVYSNDTYDAVFRTLLNDCSELIIPLINLAFGENFTGKEKIVFLPNEYYLNQDKGSQEKRITDTHFIIYGEKVQSYHWECQSTVDNSLIIRLAEYDLQIALRSRVIKKDIMYLELPRSAVLYLRHSGKTPDYMKVVLKTPEGESVQYRIPVVKAQQFSIEEIFEKKLYFLIPFYIFSHESRFKEYEENEDRLEEIKKEFEDIRKRLSRLVDNGKISAFIEKRIVELAYKVIINLARNREIIQRGVGEVMVGPTYYDESNRIFDAGKAEGFSQGISQGIEEIILRALKKGKSPREVSEFNDIPYEQVMLVYEKIK